MVHASTNILTLSNTQARELAGRFVIIGGRTYYFQNYDPGCPGQPPWRSGAEGKAYPLVERDGSLAAYLKFFTHPTQKRLDRTAWLIGQRMHTWLPSLAAAPVLWTDTRQGLPGDFQFAAYLAKAVPGETWLERKSGISRGGTPFPEELRWRCVRDLLLALAVLERADLVHGDLSPNNVIIDLDAQPRDPALYLIDFDAFFAAAAGANRAVTVAEGGTYGTDGYCPPDIAAAASAGDGSVAPYSDRYGRDMLLLELLLMGRSLPADDPLPHWNREHLQRHFTAWRARSDPTCVQTLGHLDPATIFNLSEPERPTSVDLATGLGLSLPERRVLRRVTALPRPTPAILGCRPATAKTPSGSQTPRALCRTPAVVSGSGNQRTMPVTGAIRPPSAMSRNALLSVVILVGALAICMLILAVKRTESTRFARTTQTTESREAFEARIAEEARAARQAEEDRRAAYRGYEEQMEATGSPVKSFEEWRSINEGQFQFPGILVWVLVSTTVVAVLIGYVATQDTWIRDYGGRNAAWMIAMIRGPNRRRR